MVHRSRSGGLRISLVRLVLFRRAGFGPFGDGLVDAAYLLRSFPLFLSAVRFAPFAVPLYSDRVPIGRISAC